MRVLVIDDDESIREFVGWVLADEGHEIAVAPNGAAALELLEGFQPDVILLDMRMPVMDGWEFANAYRDGRERVAPIVVMTAAESADQRADEIRAQGCIGKPFDLEELLDVVRRFGSSC